MYPHGGWETTYLISSQKSPPLFWRCRTRCARRSAFAGAMTGGARHARGHVGRGFRLEEGAPVGLRQVRGKVEGALAVGADAEHGAGHGKAAFVSGAARGWRKKMGGDPVGRRPERSGGG